jgi:hypothetical protein
MHILKRYFILAGALLFIPTAALAQKDSSFPKMFL